MGYDVIVVGAGAVGGAALENLARRGARVLGLDRFAPPHDRGSSHGQTRIIRQAYFEHPNYTPLLLKVYGLWRDLENRSGRKLYHETGLLQLGPADGVVVPGVLRSAAEHGLHVEQLSAAQIERRWPAYRVTADMVGVLEPTAGYLLVETCVQTQLDEAQKSGAEVRTGVEVIGWDPGPPVRVQTSAGVFVADRLIVAAGAWAGPLLADLGLHLQVRRKSLFWHATDPQHATAHDQAPCFLYELPHGVFYGFPRVDDRGVKVAEHTGGEPVANPLEVNRGVEPSEAERVAEFVADYLPYVTHQRTDHSVCLYTMSPDENFVVDRHPAHPHVAFAAGLSGHGFKFAPVLGQALADLALDGATPLPIGFLGLR